MWRSEKGQWLLDLPDRRKVGAGRRQVNNRSMRIRVTLPNGTEKEHRIRTWQQFSRFIAKHREHAEHASVESDGECVHLRVRD